MSELLILILAFPSVSLKKNALIRPSLNFYSKANLASLAIGKYLAKVCSFIAFLSFYS